MSRRFQSLFQTCLTRPLSTRYSAIKHLRAIHWYPHKWPRDFILQELLVRAPHNIKQSLPKGPTLRRTPSSGYKTYILEEKTSLPEQEPPPRDYNSENVLRHLRYRGWSWHIERSKMDEWVAANRPPAWSEYKLTFGKHKGKKLEEVPFTYLVKYLIPRKTGHYECAFLGDAIDDFLKRHPHIKSQAGSAKTKSPEGWAGDKKGSVRKRGRPSSKTAD